ncbi:MAG: invasion associated locus B family protein [Pseudomonadota bacterium]
MALRKLLATALAASAFVSVPAFAQQATPQGWFKTCNKNADTEICTVQQLRRASTGQLVTGVALILIDGPQDGQLLQVSVPSGRSIQPGIDLQIDGGAATKLPYVVCVPDRCVAEMRLTNEMIASFKRGGELRLTSTNFQRQPNPVPVTLTGFTAAFDGPPLDQQDVLENQKKLQEELAAKAEEARKALEAAQEAAKSE